MRCSTSYKKSLDQQHRKVKTKLTHMMVNVS